MSGQPARISVQGADTLRRTLRQAGRDLADLGTDHDRAGRLVLGTARTLAPRRTGRLAASGVVTSGPEYGQVEFTAPYAPFVRPFLASAAQQTRARWLPIYTTAVTHAIQRIRGI